jgi:uncharacterized membrane protein (DUF4010 family)
MEVQILFFAKLFLSLMVGAIIGLEREYSLSEHIPLGLRDFSLICILGMLIADFTFKDSPWFVLFGFAGVIFFSLQFYFFRGRQSKMPGLTSILMLPITYALGFLISQGYFIEVGTVVILSTILLIQKKQVHNFIASIVKNEIIDLMLFILIAFIIFPLIPSKPLVYLGVSFDAYSFWLIVVFITTISFGAHFILKYLSGKNAIVLASFFGGLISSVAAIALLAKRTLKENAENVLRVGLTSAATAALLRDFVITALISIPLAFASIYVMGFAFIGLMILSYYYYKTVDVKGGFFSDRPISIMFVFEFALIFLFTKILLTWASSNLYAFAVPSAFLTGIFSSASSIAAISMLLLEGKITLGMAQILWVSAFFGSLVGKVLIIAWQTKHVNLMNISRPLFIVVGLTLLGFLLSWLVPLKF